MPRYWCRRIAPVGFVFHRLLHHSSRSLVPAVLALPGRALHRACSDTAERRRRGNRGQTSRDPGHPVFELRTGGCGSNDGGEANRL